MLLLCYFSVKFSSYRVETESDGCKVIDILFHVILHELQRALPKLLQYPSLSSVGKAIDFYLAEALMKVLGVAM
jgi:hypothetical protein